MGCASARTRFPGTPGRPAADPLRPPRGTPRRPQPPADREEPGSPRDLGERRRQLDRLDDCDQRLVRRAFDDDVGQPPQHRYEQEHDPVLRGGVDEREEDFLATGQIAAQQGDPAANARRDQHVRNRALGACSVLELVREGQRPLVLLDRHEADQNVHRRVRARAPLRDEDPVAERVFAQRVHVAQVFAITCGHHRQRSGQGVCRPGLSERERLQMLTVPPEARDKGRIDRARQCARELELEHELGLEAVDFGETLFGDVRHRVPATGEHMTLRQSERGERAARERRRTTRAPLEGARLRRDCGG